MAMFPSQGKGLSAVAAALSGQQGQQPMSPFVWGQGGQAMNPEQVKRRQAIVDALVSQNQGTPTNLGEGIAHLGRAGIAAWQRGQVEEAETAGRTQAQKTMDALLGNEGATTRDILTAAADPWVAANPSYAPIINALISQEERQELIARQDGLLADERAQPDFQTIKDGNGDYFRYDANDPNSNPEMWFDAPEAAAGGNGQLGTTIYTMQDENGNIIPAQVSPDGGLVPAQMPDGMSFAPGALNAERAAGNVIGKGAGQAAIDLPAAQAEAQRIAIQISDLKSHPGLDEIFGKTLGIIPNQWGPTMPGSNKANAMARIDQMTGNAFLNGRQLLKGGGAITDMESNKAEAAFARLSTAQSKEEFIAGLNDFQAALEAGVAKLGTSSGNTEFSSGTVAPGAQQPMGDDPLGLF